MKASIDQVREDFDRIALLTEQSGGLDTYHDQLLRHLPPRCESALDIGCGTGVLTRRLAASAKRAVGLDLSPQMVRLARERSVDCPNVEYVVGDLLQLTLPLESYGFVISLATLHHLPTEQALIRMKSLVAPGGVLVIHDLIADDGLLDLCRSAIAMPINMTLRLWKMGRLLPKREVRKAWAEHAKYDVYLTLAEVKKLCERFLPGAKIQRHLRWRYTVVWQRPSS